MMTRTYLMPRIRFVLACVAVLNCCETAFSAPQSKAKTKRYTPITKLSLVPDAPVVEVFKGIESKQIDVRMNMTNAREGKLFFTNTTDAPLTVAIPKAIAGVQMLPQMGLGAGFGQIGNNLLGNNPLAGGMNGMMGRNQPVGGNAMPGGNQQFPAIPQQNNNNNLFNGMQGMNFFSIPPERTVQLDIQSVCLKFGLDEPHSGLKYQLVKVEDLSEDPALKQLLEQVSSTSSREIQQAAAWHIANGLSWNDLAHITNQPLPGVLTPMFSAGQLNAARRLTEQAQQDARSHQPTVKETVPLLSARRPVSLPGSGN